MAHQVYDFEVTTPAGTAITAPQATALTTPVRTLKRITVKVPPGNAAHLGFRIGMAGTQIFPVNSGSWFKTDNEVLSYDVQGVPDSGAWQCVSYNDGIYPHTIQIRFEMDVPNKDVAPAARVPLQLEAMA